MEPLAQQHPPLHIAAELLADKRACRATILAARERLPADRRVADAAACTAALLQQDWFQRAGCVLLYLSFGSELETRPLLASAWQAGKRVAAPRVDRQRGLVLHELTPTTPLQRQSWGIEAPADAAPEIALDAIDVAIVPGVAFDRMGIRLGYGGGYYDRLLAQAPTSWWRAAMAFDVQLVDALPHAAHDQPIDWLVTPTQILDFRENRRS